MKLFFLFPFNCIIKSPGAQPPDTLQLTKSACRLWGARAFCMSLTSRDLVARLKASETDYRQAQSELPAEFEHEVERSLRVDADAVYQGSVFFNDVLPAPAVGVVHVVEEVVDVE